MSLSLVQVPAEVEGLLVSSKINFNRDETKRCQVCGKIAKRICTHHYIPRYLSISSDEDTMEVCVSCHRKFDIAFTKLILWGTLDPPNWFNREKSKAWLKKYRKVNKDKIYKRQRAWNNKKRREAGIPERGPDIVNRYENIETFKEEMRCLYWDKLLSWREVAKELGLSHSCIDRWRKILKIPSRTKKEGCINYFNRVGKNG